MKSAGRGEGAESSVHNYYGYTSIHAYYGLIISHFLTSLVSNNSWRTESIFYTKHNKTNYLTDGKQL